MLKAASSFTLELEAAINKLRLRQLALEAAINKLRLRQLALDSWPCGILYIPEEIEICIVFAFTKTHNPRRLVHVHAIQQ